MPFIDVDIADAFETAALPGQGDVNAGGGGLDTSSMTNESALAAYGLDVQGQRLRAGASRGGGGHIPGYTRGGGQARVVDSKNNVYDAATGAKTGKVITPTLSGNPMADHPLWTILLIVVILFLWKFLAKEDHEEGKTLKVSLSNTIRITLMAAVGILILKWFFSVYTIASISPTIEFL